jgi:endonuclease/exonuclease/phosphatase family metal-dependent hydrolase
MKRIFLWGFALAFCLTSAIAEETPGTFRVMTYNIHHGEGTDGKVDLERIAALIKSERADIIALQEVDRGVARSGRRDLVAELARLTGMNGRFEKNIDHQGGEYGNAILTRFPILEEKNAHYPMLRQREQRGLICTVLDVDGERMLFMNTHMDYRSVDAERLANVAQIKQTLNEFPGLPVIFCGDFNDTPGGRTYKLLSGFLTDAWKMVGRGNGFTFSSASPVKRIDHMWISKDVHPAKAWILQSEASDHLPMLAEFSLQ